jgi:NADH dehydrogenase
MTGGTGFVGQNVVHALRARGLDVRCLVRERSRAGTLENWGCELAVGNVTDPESLRRAVEGCDVVVHLVAIIEGRPEEFERVMSQATRDLLSAAKEAGVSRFVLMSALGASEEKDLVPYYGAKWEMEQAVNASGLEHVVFRPSFVFGRDGGILPKLMRIARRAPVTPVVGSGEQRIQPIWVEDVAAFFAKSVDLPQAANRTFELGGPDVVSWNELYARMKSVQGKRRPTIHLPFPLMRVNAAVLEKLPGPSPITRDQVKMLAGRDNTCDVGPALDVFQLQLVPLDEQLRRAAA